MYAFISSEASYDIILSLKEEGFNTIPLPSFSKLSQPVSTHADMIIFSCDDTVFLPRDYQFPNIEVLRASYENIVYINDSFSPQYPYDVFLNIALVGNDVFVNERYASKQVLEYLKQKGKIIHNVAQGYAHCSACILSEDALITSDKGIASSARKAGKDVLLLPEGNISLPPYSYGFIGGACGCTDKKVYFCGSYELHPQKGAIEDFCKKHEKIPVSLCKSPLSDVGGIFFA